MKIYLDLILLLNFFFDFIILYGTKIVLKEKTKLHRLVLGSIVGSISTMLLFIKLNNYTLLIIKLLISILINTISFGNKNIFKNTVYFYLISIILGGSLYLLDISYAYKNKGIIFLNSNLEINIIVIMIISPIIIYLYIKENKAYKTKYSNIYIIEIEINNKIIKLKSMIDTGNNLKDPISKKDVLLINNNIKLPKKRFIYVPYKALNTEGIVKCIKPDRIIIENKVFKNCLIGLSETNFSLNDIDCILPNNFKEEL